MDVLIADDDPVVRHILTAILASDRHQVATVESGSECLANLQDRIKGGSLPDLIFLDFQLQDLPGTEVLRQLRTLPGGSAPKVIMVSGNTEEEVRAIDPDFKPDAYLEKPFDAAGVAAAVARATGEVPPANRRD